MALKDDATITDYDDSITGYLYIPQRDTVGFWTFLGKYVECDWKSGERVGDIEDMSGRWPGIWHQASVDGDPLYKAPIGGMFWHSATEIGVCQPSYFYTVVEYATGARTQSTQYWEERWPGAVSTDGHWLGYNGAFRRDDKSGDVWMFGSKEYTRLDWKHGKIQSGYGPFDIHDKFPGIPKDVQVANVVRGPDGDPRFFGTKGEYLQTKWSSGELVRTVRNMFTEFPGLVGFPGPSAFAAPGTAPPEGRPRIPHEDT